MITFFIVLYVLFLQVPSYALAIATLLQFRERWQNQHWSSRKDFISDVVSRILVIYFLNILAVMVTVIVLKIEIWSQFYCTIAISFIALTLLAPILAFPPDKAILGGHRHPPFGR